MGVCIFPHGDTQILLHALLIPVQGFRIHAKLEASSKYPVFFIARERTGGILSFGLPLQPEGYKFLPLFLVFIKFCLSLMHLRMGV